MLIVPLAAVAICLPDFYVFLPALRLAERAKKRKLGRRPGWESVTNERNERPVPGCLC
jgi:hypothetical protein